MNLRRLNPRSSRGGFTLIELAISGALMALILVSGYLCLSSGLSSQKMIESRSETLQAARVALNLMSADLRAACPLSKDIQFVGINRTLDGLRADNVDFGTHHYRPQRSREGDFCQISYFVARDPQSGIHALWRRRNPAFGLNPLSGGRQDELVRGLRGLKLEYYDGLDWYETWGDPDPDPQGRGRAKAESSFREKRNLTGLPEAVRITLWIENGRESSRSDTNEPPIVIQSVARLYLAGSAAGEASSGNTGNSGKKSEEKPSEENNSNPMP